MDGTEQGEASDGPAAATAEELERGTERLARLVLHAQALADRKRARALLDGSSSAAQEGVRRLEAGVEVVRRALGSILDQALGDPGRARARGSAVVPAQRRRPEE